MWPTGTFNVITYFTSMTRHFILLNWKRSTPLSHFRCLKQIKKLDIIIFPTEFSIYKKHKKSHLLYFFNNNKPCFLLCAKKNLCSAEASCWRAASRESWSEVKENVLNHSFIHPRQDKSFYTHMYEAVSKFFTFI